MSSNTINSENLSLSEIKSALNQMGIPLPSRRSTQKELSQYLHDELSVIKTIIFDL